MRARMMMISTLLLIPMAVTACGDDDKEVTHDEFYVAACAKLTGIPEPDFNQFFTDHPDASLADWAEFLPGVVSQMDQIIDVLETTPHPPADDAKVDAIVAAVNAVRGNFSAGLAAAKSGDDVAFDAAEEKNQGADVAAMEAAFQALESRDCPTTNS